VGGIMKVELNPTDLAVKHQKPHHEGDLARREQSCETRDVTFDMLNEAAKMVVEQAGKATFFPWDRNAAKVVHFPG